jgi:hypothetical protein
MYKFQTKNLTEPNATLKLRYTFEFYNCIIKLVSSFRRSQWPCGLRHRSAAAWLRGSRVQLPLRAWMFVSFLCLYVVLSCVGRGLCDGLITCPEESYCASDCVWLGNVKGGGSGPHWDVEPNKMKKKLLVWSVINSSSRPFQHGSSDNTLRHVKVLRTTVCL